MSEWSGALRLTFMDAVGEPSRSIVFYAVGGVDPEDVARRCLDHA
jgi:hypothetical protein